MKDFARRLAVLAALLVSSAGFSEMPASNATSLHCQQCKDDVGGGQHSFEGGGALMDCHILNSCHANWQTGWCTEYHAPCGVSFQKARQDAPEIASAVIDANAREVHALLSRYGRALTYNPRREALQVLDCDGHVVAHLPVNQTVAEVLN